jgi:DNA-binding transcriptional LysR family regulator
MWNSAWARLIDGRPLRVVDLTPRVVQEAEETLTLLGLASTGFGIAFVPSGLMHITVPNLIFKPLSDDDATTEVCLGIRADDTSATLATFRRMAHAVRTRDRRI